MTANSNISTRTTPPGPKALYPGQNLLAMIRSPLALLSEGARYGDVVQLTTNQAGTYLLTNPEDIRDVLVTNHRMFHKNVVLRRMRNVLGDGLLTSEDELHLRQRRLIQPAFHRQRISEYGRIMTDYTLQASARWQDGGTYDIHKEMMRLTMVIVGQALFGADVEGEAPEIGQAITTLLRGSRRLLLPFWERIQYWPLPGNRENLAAARIVDQKVREMVAERRSEQARGESEPHHDLMEMLLTARDVQGDGKGMSDELVRDEVLTLFIAGHETTSNALTWTLYLLSQHPQVEAQLHDELARVLGGYVPSAEDADHLPYTRKVLSESMRLYPPAWIMGRQALVAYRVGGYLLPAGANLLLSPWVTHRDARFYSDPLRFDPERWTPEAIAARPRFSYFPFGGGPRLCIGEPFAWMEGILLLATIAQRWQMRLDPHQRVEPLPQVTLRPKYGLRMKLTKR